VRYPRVTITADMLREARAWAPRVKIQRTVASRIDALTGVLGEMAFAQFLFADWRRHQLGANKGKADFDTLEVKASAFPFSPKLHLLVREDYARSRKPLCYVQVIIDISARALDVPAGTQAVLCGYATCEEVDAAPLKDFGSKFGGDGGYRCHYLPVLRLHPIEDLRLI